MPAERGDEYSEQKIVNRGSEVRQELWKQTVAEFQHCPWLTRCEEWRCGTTLPLRRPEEAGHELCVVCLLLSQAGWPLIFLSLL